MSNRKFRQLAWIMMLGVAEISGALAVEAPLELKWASLIPVAPPQAKAAKPFFAGATPRNPHNIDTPPPAGDSKWMSAPAGPPPAASAPPPVVTELNGKKVRIGGYVVPLDFDTTKVTEFLLVPFVGACIHVPPPPANQIIYVKASSAFSLKGEFDPVYVTGTISTAGQFTGLAETGYSIEAEMVENKNE